MHRHFTSSVAGQFVTVTEINKFIFVIRIYSNEEPDNACAAQQSVPLSNPMVAPFFIHTEYKQWAYLSVITFTFEVNTFASSFHFIIRKTGVSCVKVPLVIEQT
jgi:hypothetical protein